VSGAVVTLVSESAIAWKSAGSIGVVVVVVIGVVVDARTVEVMSGSVPRMCAVGSISIRNVVVGVVALIENEQTTRISIGAVLIGHCAVGSGR